MLSLSRGSFCLLALLTLAALVLRFWRLGDMPLFGDEAFYLLLIKRPELAYFDHPAGIAWLLRLSTALGGNGEWGVRWLSALLSVACVPLVYSVGRRYVSAAGGWVAAVALAFGANYVIAGRIVYPDSLQLFLLLVNLLALSPVLDGAATLRQYTFFGLTLALLLNVKLTSGFYLAALVLYVVVWRRDLLRQRGMWLAAGLVALGLLPLIVWNATHEWAVVGWAIYQGQGFGLPSVGWWRSSRHAIAYVSPPLALLSALALLGLPQVIGPATAARNRLRLLWLAAALLLLPVLFSSANSPRNLDLGLAVLLPLVGWSWDLNPTPAAVRDGRGSLLRAGYWGLAGLALVAVALYGVGTAVALTGPTPLPQSVATPGIVNDAAGWPEFARQFNPPPDRLVFAVDYSIAGQVRHYTGLPAYSSAGQFRLWGVPDFKDATVLHLNFVPPDLVGRQLRADFEVVSGPQAWRYTYPGGTKVVYVWQAEGRRVPVGQFLDDLDYLTLAREAGAFSGQHAVFGE